MKTNNLDLRNMDCMELMKEFPDDYFDLAVTSPPYNLNLRVNQKGDGYCSRQVTKELSTKYENYSDNLPMAEYEKFLIDVITELNRVSRMTFFNIQMVTGNKPALFKVMGHFAEQIKEVVIWDKGHGQPAIGSGVLNSAYEYIIILGGSPITRAFKDHSFERGSLDNIWRSKKGSSSDANHRASFPISLVDTILSNFGKRGGRVIDPFLGTGTTGVSTHYAGMHLTGSEIDPDYFKSACERVRRETSQMDMFAFPHESGGSEKR